MSLLDGHFQYFVDVLALVANIQGFAVIAFTVTDVTRYIDVG